MSLSGLTRKLDKLEKAYHGRNYETVVKIVESREEEELIKTQIYERSDLGDNVDTIIVRLYADPNQLAGF